MEIGFSLGSNEGRRQRLLMQAKNRLLSAPRTCFVAQSPIYETTPVDVKPEYLDRLFLNAVVVVESELPLERWASCVARIEESLGRVRGVDRNAPRTIDVDLIYAGDRSGSFGGLVVPHPRWAERRFVAQPLCDVRPELVLPGETRTVSEVLRALPPDEGMRIFEDGW